MKTHREKLSRRIKEILLAGAVLTTALILRRTSISAEETAVLFRQEISRAEDGAFHADFPEEIEKNGRTYVLTDVIYHEQVSEPLTHVSAPVRIIETERFTPAKRVSVDGTAYVLESVQRARTLVSGRSAPAEAYGSHDDIDIPEPALLQGTAVQAEVTDPETGKKRTGAVPYAFSEAAGEFWQEDLPVRLVFTESDADYFDLEGVLYESDETVPLPESAYPDVLRLLERDASRNRILGIAWESVPYEDGNVLCRDASVRMDVLHRVYRDVYAGEIALPDLKYVTYRLRYRESDEDLFRRTVADAEAVYALKED